MGWTERFEQARRLAGRRLYHAALEIWLQLAGESAPSQAETCRLWDEIGKVSVQLGDNDSALTHFGHAVRLAETVQDQVKCRMHLALTYRRMSEYDKAYRMLAQVAEEFSSSLCPAQLAVLYANLGVVQGLNEFHSDAVESTLRSLAYCAEAGLASHRPTLFNNLGALYLDTGQHAEAERYLAEAVELRDGQDLSSLSELSRLYMLRGDWEKSVAYAKRALPLVWSSIMTFEAEEIARLCRVLAHLASLTGLTSMALRFIEKAQLLFGKLRLWREWQSAQAVMDEWTGATGAGAVRLDGASIRQLEQFVLLLDALNAQELLTEEFSRLLDTRVLYAEALAAEAGLSPGEIRAVVYACRFADYGLTSIEPDVLARPDRSPQAWSQYQLHPSLSVEMLRIVELPAHVLTAIGDHHERFDGSGYPGGKSGVSISRLAQILSIADRYAQGVVLERRTHSDSLRTVTDERGRAFDPGLTDCFVRMFDCHTP
ncbi:MAG: tetratricopeptide repeat protein [Alicyclobacillus sp.]|nr:tetratricopeptide repeat protein [Alicyclobacillus sp.]